MKTPFRLRVLFCFSRSGVFLVYYRAVRNPGPVVDLGQKWIVVGVPHNWSDVRFLIHRLWVSKRHPVWIHVLHHLHTEHTASRWGVRHKQVPCVSFIRISASVKEHLYSHHDSISKASKYNLQPISICLKQNQNFIWKGELRLQDLFNTFICPACTHGAAQNVVGSIPRKHTYWQKQCIAWMHCKSLWIKASAKCINVNYNNNFKTKSLSRKVSSLGGHICNPSEQLVQGQVLY